MRRRIIFTIFVAVTAAITCGGIRNNTYAAEHTASTYTELSNYVTNAPAGEETIIKITADMNIESKLILPTNSNVTIDGQGHTLTQAAGHTHGFIYGNGAGSFALKNITLQGIAGEWEAKWEKMGEFLLPSIKLISDEIENKTSDPIIELNSGDDFIFSNSTINNFASQRNLVYARVAHSEISGNIFKKNYSDDAILQLGYFGGINDRDHKISNDEFADNYASYLINAPESKEQKINRLLIKNNWVTQIAIYVNAVTVVIDQVNFSDNNLGDIALAHLRDGGDGSIIVANSTFADNIINSVGGGAMEGPIGSIILASSGNLELSNTDISNNSGVSWEGAVLYLPMHDDSRLRLTNGTKITNNTLTYDTSVAAMIASGEYISSAEMGAGLAVLNAAEEDEATTYISADNSVRIFGNSTPTYGFGDDVTLVTILPRTIEDAFQISGFENIANWYVDNAGNRYNPSSPIEVKDFSSLNLYASSWSMGSGNWPALGLKAILPDNSEKNPNTVDSFSVTIIISTISVITLAGISLKTKARR